MVERSITVTRKPAFARKKAVAEPAGPPPTTRIWCMVDLSVCEENDLVMDGKLVDSLNLVYGFIDDGIKWTALVLEKEETCFCSCDLCRRAYISKHEKMRYELLEFI